MEFFTFGLGDPVTETSTEVLGGKGAGLVWMHQQGVPVPPGFVIPTTVWAEWQKKPKTTMKAIAKELPVYMMKLREHFGYVPLVSVRSGARVSCPGMMDTILNVGIDNTTQTFWSEKLGTECFGSSLHRLIVMYGSVVKGLKREDLEEDLITAIHQYTRQTGEEFPDANGQLLGAIEAVFKSWDNERAKVYRKLNKIPREWGTAVTVQAMVFGNLNDQSGTGVLFTRNPDTGQAIVTGEFLPNAQGEDIVAGIRTPMPLVKMVDWNGPLAATLHETVLKLEVAKKDVQDVEFTVQDGKLYLLQTRNAKRSATAAIKIALDMVKEGLIDEQTAIKRVSAKQFDLAQQASIDPSYKKKEAYKGIGACSGVVSGKPVFSKDDAINCKEPCILITEETTPDDIEGMNAAVGVVTMVGGLTSHAAVVARSMNRACVVGVGQTAEAFKEVEILTIDGATGRIWTEQVPTIGGEQNGLIREFSALVTKQLGVVPVVFSAPSTAMPEALLYLRHQIADAKAAAKIVGETLLRVDRVYLDLMPSEAAEQDFYSICGTDFLIQQLLVELQQISKEATDRLVVMSTVPHPFKAIGRGDDLRSLVLADGEVLMGAKVDDPAIQKVLAWKQAEGLKTVLVGQYQPGVKSMVSIPQALQLVQEA